MHAVFRSNCTPLRLHFAVLGLGLSSALAVTPYNSATVKRIENKVSVGQVQNGKPVQRTAIVSDVIGAHDYLSTETESRAELEFADKSLVRVGQNTVFSFDASSRTLSLEKGAMLFYVPPGSGGGNIKTPTLTAAITGTVAKVSENMIAVLSGQIHTKWGTVHAGEAIQVVDGTVRIFKFDPSEATTGKLYWFGGPPPEIPEVGYEKLNDAFQIPDLHLLDILHFNEVDPRVRNFHEHDARPPERGVKVPKPPNTPPVENPPY